MKASCSEMFGAADTRLWVAWGRNPRDGQNRGQTEMTQPEPANRAITPELLRTISALSGIEISIERSEALAPQAAQQLTLMRALEAIPLGVAEPAGELRLDRERGGS